MIYVLYAILFYAFIIILFSYDPFSPDADYLIVLGSGLNHDRETFTMIRRIDRAYLYLDRNPDCKVIVSGGISDHNTISEASVMAELLNDRKISKNRIIIEDRSKNTKENLLYCRKLIEEGKKVVICTNDYHILRSKLNAMKCGMRVNSIFCQSNLFELLIHIPIEEVLILKDLIS